MANVATLTLKGTSDLKAIGTDLKSIATEAKNVSTPLKQVGTSLDQSAKSATTFGQKVKSFGSTFSSSIASVGTLAGTVVNLSRQYQDLGDSQIRVDKAQLKVSRTTEATSTAQSKLNALVAKGVTSGAEYDKALLDVKQAQEAQTLATTMLGEAQEDQQRAQENFWIGLVPTVTSAGGSVMSILKDMGGTKGFGGLKTAITGLGGKTSGLLGGLIGGLGGIGGTASSSVTGLNGAATATTGLGGAMKATALSMLPVVLALGGVALATKAAGMVIHEIISIMKGDMLEATKSLQSLIDFYTKIGSVIPMGAGFAIFTALKPEVAKLRAELEKTPQTIKPVSSELQHMDDIGKGMSGTIDNIIGGVLGLTQKADAATPALNGTGGAIDGIGTAASGAQPPIDGVTTSLGSMANQATITMVGMGTVSTGMIGVAHNAALVTAQTDPFNASLAITAQNARGVKGELAGLTAEANRNAKAFQTDAKGMDIAAKSLQRLQQIASKGPQYPGVNSKPGQGYRVPGGGVQTKKNVNGPSYTLNGVTYYGSVAPPNRKAAASGMHEMVDQPTWILAGESGKESVHIDKPGRNVGDGGDVYVGPIYIGEDQVMGRMRYKITKGSSVVK
jgi:hypothetical protein